MQFGDEPENIVLQFSNQAMGERRVMKSLKKNSSGIYINNVKATVFYGNMHVL